MLRRQFLTRVGALGLALPAPVDVVRWLSAAGRRPPSERKTLVLVELTGGNDGLNTIVPHADPVYQRARPTLRIDPRKVHRIDDSVGFAPALESIAKIFRAGGLTIVQNVGMAHPDRSHFTSLDRWHAGDARSDARMGGWVGRGLDGIPDVAGGLAGIAIGERSVPRLLQHPARQALGCETLGDLVPSPRVREMLASEPVRRMDAIAGSPEDQRLAALARDVMGRLLRVANEPLAPDSFPDSELGRRMADALRVVAGDLDVRVVFVRRSGFDTHVRQAPVQTALLREVDLALSAFQAALVRRRLVDRVLVVVYSEFGRRIAENGSAGTDHGSAGPVLLLGGGLSGAVIGEAPDLRDQDDGDVRAKIDFRRVLAQGLKHMGHPSPADVFGATPLR